MKSYQMIRIAAMAGCMAFAASCNNENETLPTVRNGRVPLEVDVNVTKTRSIITGTTLPKGATFGIFALKGNNDEALENGMNNQVTYDGSSYTLTNKIYLPPSIDVPVYAYYPYNPAYKDINYLKGEIPVDVESQTDYLYGYSADSENHLTYANIDNPKASLLFKHALSRITFIIKKAEDNTKEYAVDYAELSGVYEKAHLALKVNPEEQPIISPSGTAIITAKPDNSSIVSSGTTVEYLAIPMETGEETRLTVRLVDGSSISAPLPTTQWLSGQQYTYTVTIQNAKLIISQALITPWVNTDQGGLDIGDENYAGASIGDIYYSDGTYSSKYYPEKTPIGYVFALTDEKDGNINRTLRHSKHGRIIALKDVSDISYIWAKEDGDITAIQNYQVSNVMHTTTINSMGMITQWYVPEKEAWQDFNGQKNTLAICKESYPAAYACYTYETEGRAAGSWYLPAAGELKLLELLCNEKIIYNVDNDWFTAMGTSYWSSTEINSKEAAIWYNSEPEHSSEKQNQFPVRAASTF